MLRQYDAEIGKGMMVKCSVRDAITTYGSDLIIAATGAIAKKGKSTEDEVRVIYDGTNGIALNQEIKIRDQIRFPIAPDVKCVLAECAEEGGPHSSLDFDVDKAHRRCPVEEAEGGRQARQVKGSAASTLQSKRSVEAMMRERAGESGPGKPSPLRLEDFSPAELSEQVFLNTVGTFGVTSAGYWWGRAGGSAMRLAHYVIGYIDAVYALLCSDDRRIVGRTAHYERGILLFLFVLVCVGIPISWRKVRGGERTEWIGYLVDVGRFEMGISMTRAAWASSCCLDKATEGAVRLGELREGLGRLQFIAGPIETLRPFLGPLYA